MLSGWMGQFEQCKTKVNKSTKQESHGFLGENNEIQAAYFSKSKFRYSDYFPHKCHN